MTTKDLIPFVKGDKRINRKGRPKSFDQLRALAQQIAAEPIDTETKVTRIEAMLKIMSSSRNPADRALFLAYAYGKPRETLDVNVEGKITWAQFIEQAKANDKPETGDNQPADVRGDVPKNTEQG
jgi:hypothetical protein